MKPLVLLPLSATILFAGPYPDGAGTVGTDAVSKDDPRFVAWAAGHTEVVYGTDVDPEWKTPAKATGPATLDIYDIVCLGNGGRITMYFPKPVRDGDGADFAVFENGVSNVFLELAFVEVSSDGVHFHRFPNDSLTASLVGAFGSLDPTNLSGLASKHRYGFGTPFDLAAIPDDPTLDKQRVVFVRIIDIIGDGRAKDTSGDPIYDPTPTIGSGGFDLEAIGVIHQNDEPLAVTNSGFDAGTWFLEWPANPGEQYRIETATTLGTWLPVETLPAGTSSPIHWTALPTSDPQRFWRVVRITP